MTTPTIENAHIFDLYVKNLGIHGVYIEPLSVVNPKGIAIQEISVREPKKAGFTPERPREDLITGQVGADPSA